jgi:two-component system sensor kinase
MRRFAQTNDFSRRILTDRELCGLRADGEEFPVEISISKTGIGGHSLFTAILRDITERRQSEDALRESHRQLRELSGSLQVLIEEERSRIARELHDELGQRLTGMKLDLSWLGHRPDMDQPEVAAKLASMKELVESTVAAVRRISYELHPAILDDLGLGAAIDWLAEEFSARTAVAVERDLDHAIDGLSEPLSIAVFRIVQESLTNVARHAGASRVALVLRRIDERIHVEIGDNGRGLPPARPGRQRHFGLVGIRERAMALGGELEIRSVSGQGTTIVVDIPLVTPSSPEPQ